MPAKCSICYHVDRQRLDADLLADRPLSKIAQDYNVSPSALHRHKHRHLTQPMAEALEARHESQVAYGSDLLRRLEGLYARAQGLLDRAEQQGSLTGALSAIRETRECLRLIGQVTKEISSSVTVAVFVQSPTWAQFKAALVGALASFPDALVAVQQTFRVLAEAPGRIQDRIKSSESNLGQRERPETREEG